jgi:imidazoleglycerol phosphate synthase cyclase subunit
MLAKRIIPCLDLKDGRVVKGINFLNLKDAGDPVEQAAIYDREGADELVLLDITATNEARRTMLDVVRHVSEAIFIPFCVGGGITSIEDISATLTAGADKVSLNSRAVKNPELITEGARRFGSQCIVVAIDPKFVNGRWEVHINGGQTPTGLEAIAWAKQVESLGAGEILLTCMDRDGTRSGYEVELTRAIAEAVSIPVIASGGAGAPEHFYDVLTTGKADAALAASLFHYHELGILEVKNYLGAHNVPVRLPLNAAEALLKWDQRGLITTVVQDATTEQVLMVAWMNADALRLTEQTGEAHFWSRSRKEIWRKGATSGNIMRVQDIRVDCDADTLLLRVNPSGPACHTGATSCFFRDLKELTYG